MQIILILTVAKLNVSKSKMKVFLNFIVFNFDLKTKNIN
jgi:hypothetical protein